MQRLLLLLQIQLGGCDGMWCMICALSGAGVSLNNTGRVSLHMQLSRTIAASRSPQAVSPAPLTTRWAAGRDGCLWNRFDSSAICVNR